MIGINSIKRGNFPVLQFKSKNKVDELQVVNGELVLNNNIVNTIVDDLTTGGSNVALSAEQGKTLEENITLGFETVDTKLSEIRYTILQHLAITTTYVYSLPQITAHSTEDMTIDISEYVVWDSSDGYREVRIAENYSNIIPAEGISPRFDLVSLAATDQYRISVITGFAAETPEGTPNYPDTPAGDIALAYIHIRYNATTITADDIIPVE